MICPTKFYIRNFLIGNHKQVGVEKYWSKYDGFFVSLHNLSTNYLKENHSVNPINIKS